MKLLLTSAGIKNASIHDALVDLLGKPIAECDALCIPTASYGHAPNGIRGAWRFITGNATTPMCELGWKSLGVLELTALPTLAEEAWVPVVEEADVLLGNGGDALYLSHHMRLSGLADLLPSLEPRRVDLEQRQRFLGDPGRDDPFVPHLGDVANAPEDAVGDSRRPARPPRDQLRRRLVELDGEDPRRSPHDRRQLLGRVQVEPEGQPEPVAERRRQEAGTGGRPDERERGQVERQRAGGGALAHHDVEPEVLE